ncbi:MAG: CapA family protein [Oscillospiraceae bacterium]|jgi:poly-gamma-glutamate synthesis protein (capsule biosynthesis protein)|nr:CapA family protein [Oscillospiraceae bacterium]
MASNRKKRGVSFGTWLMLAATALAVSMSAWIFPRLSGSLEDVAVVSGALIQALAATAVPGETPVAVYQPTIEPTAAPTPTPPPQSRTVTLGVSGQIYLDGNLRKSGLIETGAYNFESIFSQIAPYASAPDAMMVTLETTVSDAPPYDTYCAPSEILTALKNAGVDIINLGTERILEEGFEGLSKTRAAVEMHGFSVTGAHRSPDEQALPLTLDLNGVKVAVLSYTYGLSTVGAKQGSKDQRAIAVNTIDPQRIRQDAETARERGANLVIVNMNWGKRTATKPAAAETKIVDEIADCGVDVILGVHPSSAHKMERRNVTWADGTEHEVFIAYSLGNFLTNERETDQIVGMLLTLQFTLDPGSDRARLTDAKWMPTWVMRWDSGGYQYRILPAGTETQPAEMTDGVYRNMRRAYENIIKRYGDTAAVPVAE